MSGGVGNDRLSGGNLKDLLSGDDGDDVIEGGLGADRMTGGIGADRFVYTSIAESGIGITSRDTITDFDSNLADIIDVSAIDAIDGGADDAFTFIGSGGFTGLGQIRVQQGTDFTLVAFNTTATIPPT